MKKYILIAILIIFVISVIIGNIFLNNRKQSENTKILTSFYPLYIITMNVTEGAQNIEVTNMTEKLKGCIHEYTLTTEDLKKFETTDVYIQNGNGIESFSDKVKELYPKIKVINSTENIVRTIEDEEEDEINPHMWLNLDNYIKQIENITNELKSIDSQNSEIYETNKDKYTKKIQELKEKKQTLNLNGKKAICLNEGLVYLLDEIGMDVTSIETNHEHSSLSALQLKQIIEQIKKENIKLVFIDKDDDTKIADTIKNETEVEIYRLDSGMYGDNSLESYLNTMNNNYDVLLNISI